MSTPNNQRCGTCDNILNEKEECPFCKGIQKQLGELFNRSMEEVEKDILGEYKKLANKNIRDLESFHEVLTIQALLMRKVLRRLQRVLEDSGRTLGTDTPLYSRIKRECLPTYKEVKQAYKILSSAHTLFCPSPGSCTTFKPPKNK